jgi:hypothetical protein
LDALIKAIEKLADNMGGPSLDLRRVSAPRGGMGDR